MTSVLGARSVRLMAGGDQDYVRGGLQKADYGPGDVVEWSCPLCGSEEARKIKTERGHLGVVLCRNCDLIRVNPRARAPESCYFGDVEVYEREMREVLRGRPHHRRKNYLHDLDQIEAVKADGRLLDVGSGTGTFLHYASQRSWAVEGVDASESLARLARKLFGLKITTGRLEETRFPPASFDVVTLVDVFEHLTNPIAVLRAAREILKPDGLLFVKVPNGPFNILKYRVRTLLGKSGDDFDAYEHVCHYSQDTLQSMLRAGGFCVDSVRGDPPVQPAVWHRYVGHYYQHKSPFILDWPNATGREVLHQVGRVENLLRGKVGILSQSLSCMAHPQRTQ